MFGSIKDQLTQELAEIEAAGLYKRERVITSAQDAEITLDDGSSVLNFCANNYLGLSSHPRVVEAAKRAIDTHGFGMSSVRFICGTQDIHKELEQRIADFHLTEDTILYAAACLADETRGVAFVHHDHGFVGVGEVTDFVDLGHVTVHREHAVGHDDDVACPIGPCLLQALFELDPSTYASYHIGN